MSGRLLKAIVVDDTVTYRAIMTRTLGALSGVEVVGKAANGREALERVAQCAPDVVFLDIVMPEMDGIETLRLLRRDHPDVAVLMVSDGTDAGRTMQALSLGAVDFIKKSEAGAEGASALRRRLEQCLRVVAAQHRKQLAAPSPAPAAPGRVSSRGRLARPAAAVDLASRLVVIGVSTGGPRALGQLLPAIAGDIDCPVLVVQHMPSGFTEPLAESLNRRSPLEVSEAKDGDAVEPRRVLIAPGGKHMELEEPEGGAGGHRIRLTNDPPINECRPSVDVLFRSVARCYRGSVLAMILTGIGRDGREGVRALREGGAYCVAQDQGSCVVYGMPRAVVEAELADEVLPLEEIGPRITAFGVDSAPGIR